MCCFDLIVVRFAVYCLVGGGALLSLGLLCLRVVVCLICLLVF